MSVSPSYQIIFLGAPDARQAVIRDAVRERILELGLKPDDISFLDQATAASRDRRLPQIGIFLADPSVAINSSLIGELISDSVVIVPVVSSLSRVTTELPPQLTHVNALELGLGGAGLDRLVALVFETFRLLRAERRLFISYKRDDAQPFSERLYDALDARGFDVFIDVRSVPPAVDFQAELWHRMSDSDVVVLVDTPGFRSSRWTTAELARANATNIQILHLLWPGQPEDSSSSFSHFFKLKVSDFLMCVPGRGRYITQAALGRICSEAERLRARAIAARHRYLVDNFCDAARDLSLVPAVQSERWIAVPLRSGRTLAVVPAVGVPTSERLNIAFDALINRAGSLEVWVVYDNRGILSTWLSHLDWLNRHLPLRAVRMSEAPDMLRALV
jgi:hypothetical protein